MSKGDVLHQIVSLWYMGSGVSLRARTNYGVKMVKFFKNLLSSPKPRYIIISYGQTELWL